MPSEEEAIECASECWEQGFNCAESVIRGVSRGLGIELPEAALMMATPFGGGVGRSEDMCGALSGGVMIIGAIMGRKYPEEDRYICYDAARNLHQQFEGNFGSSICRVLNEGDYTSPDHRARCKKYVLETVRMVYKVLNQE